MPLRTRIHADSSKCCDGRNRNDHDNLLGDIEDIRERKLDTKTGTDLMFWFLTRSGSCILDA